MRPQSDFWAALHRLAAELEQEGQSSQQQVKALLRQMEVMPPEILNAHVANLEIAAPALIDLLNRAKRV